MTVLDSCIVMDLADPSREHHARSTEAVAKRLKVGGLYAPDIVFAEVSSGYPSAAHARGIFNELDIKVVRLSDEALYLAATRFRNFKKPGLQKEEISDFQQKILPDFYVGALAAAEGIPLLTRDKKRKWGINFPNIKVIFP